MPFSTASFDIVIFDLDGTLVDSVADIANAINQTLAEAGRSPLPREQIAGYVGDGAAKLVQRAFAAGANQPPSGDQLSARVVRFAAHYAQHICDETVAYPGVDLLLRRLSVSMPLAVLTNKPGGLARQLLAGLGLDRYFTDVVGDGDGFARKPDAQAGRWLLQRHGVDPARALIVGDGLPDVRFAHALGGAAAAVTWGYVSRELLAAERPTFVVESPEQLLAVVLGPALAAGADPS
jgi:phosphoglycolate phosphatase